MLLNRIKDSFFSSRFIFRLSFLQIIVITLFVLLSSYAVYIAACQLVEHLTIPTEEVNVFRNTLFRYLIVFSVLAIIIGSAIHLIFTQKIIKPINMLISSTKEMKKGKYPKQLNIDEKGELGELIKYFNEMVEQLEEKEKDRKKIISDLSHEFRTPLTNLNGYLYALKKEAMHGNTEIYEALYQESMKLTQLVKQVDQLKEWENHRKNPINKYVEIEIEAFVENAVNVFKWTLVNKGIDLQIKVKPRYVNVPPSILSQVLNNIIDNAIKYYKGNKAIQVEGEVVGEEYKISVTGEGSEMSTEEKAHVFNRYYRVKSPGTENKEGSGLGLSISKELVEQCHGRIGLDSDGKCHTFWFTFKMG